MKPDKETFKKEYDDIEGPKATKVKKLSSEYEKTTRTIYRWIDEMIDAVPDLDDDFEEIEKKWVDWVEDYRDPDEDYPEYYQKFAMNNDALFVCMSDTHFGSKAIKKTIKALAKKLDKIKSHPQVFILFVGDMIDYGPASPRGLKQDQQLKYKNQLKMARAFVDEIGERIIAITSGCHSHFTYNVTGEFPEEELAKDTYGGIFLGDGGVLNLRVGTNTYRVFMSHKLRGRAKTNPASGLLNIALYGIDFDIGVTAHNHSPAVQMRPLRDKVIHMINCGAEKGMDMYARKNGYTPTLSATPCFFLSSKEREIISFMDLDEGLKYMEMFECYTKAHS